MRGPPLFCARWPPSAVGSFGWDFPGAVVNPAAPHASPPRHQSRCRYRSGHPRGRAQPRLRLPRARRPGVFPLFLRPRPDRARHQTRVPPRFLQESEPHERGATLRGAHAAQRHASAGAAHRPPQYRDDARGARRGLRGRHPLPQPLPLAGLRARVATRKNPHGVCRGARRVSPHLWHRGADRRRPRLAEQRSQSRRVRRGGAALLKRCAQRHAVFPADRRADF